MHGTDSKFGWTCEPSNHQHPQCHKHTLCRLLGKSPLRGSAAEMVKTPARIVEPHHNCPNAIQINVCSLGGKNSVTSSYID